MEIYEVTDIEEAVELAHTLKAEKRYNWFRGQVQDWAPHSSFARVLTRRDPEEKEKAVRRAEMFFEWCGKFPELRYLQQPEHVHDCFAIMQHYGIPTHYIDFTTDPGVAGFFAADTASPPTEGKSCIYCLDSEELMELWDILKTLEERKGTSIELVTINVNNLWRLQAQHGVFVFANYNWEIDYPMDRILFPYSGYPSYPPPERIYPEDKSPLEQLLDQYFHVVESTFWNEEARRWVEESQSRGGNAAYVEWNSWSEGYYPEAFPNRARMGPLPSWSPESLRAWEVTPEEDYYQTVGPTQSLKLRSHAGPEDIRRSVTFGVNELLRSDPTIRRKAVNWSFSDLPESLAQDELKHVLRPIWNGMRRLPYEDGEIAAAFGSAAALLMVKLGRKGLEHRQEEQRFSECFGECMTVGFGNQDGSGAQGLVTRESLHKALRRDIAELLAPAYEDFAKDVYQLFQIIYNPRIMFDFNAFKETFAREVIPAQAVSRNSLIIFNPARLRTFGLP